MSSEAWGVAPIRRNREEQVAAGQHDELLYGADGAEASADDRDGQYEEGPRPLGRVHATWRR